MEYGGTSNDKFEQRNAVMVFHFYGDFKWIIFTLDVYICNISYVIVNGMGKFWIIYNTYFRNYTFKHTR